MIFFGIKRRLAAAVLAAAVGLPAARAQAPAAGAEAARVAAAVEGGLKWLADNQITNGPAAGSWPARNYPAAVASFAGLAFLANGHLPGEGPYGRTVSAALEYVKAGMNRDGYLGGAGDESTLYTHAICTLFGLACLGMMPEAEADRELADWCRKSLRVILQAQKIPKRAIEQGGWRYEPGSPDSDVSVTSWQLLALHAARQCGFETDPVAVQDALRYIGGAWVETADAAGYTYRPGTSLTNKLSAGSSGVAFFIKRLIEPDAETAHRKAADFLRGFPPSWGGPTYNGYFYFVSFYLTQGLFQQGGEDWQNYSAALRAILVERQEGDGRWPFPPGNRTHGDNVGHGYSTALAVLMLSLDKQYLPMYQRQMSLY